MTALSADERPMEHWPATPSPALPQPADGPVFFLSRHCPSYRRQPTLDSPLCSMCYQRQEDMKQRLAQVHCSSPRRARCQSLMTQHDLFEHMRADLELHGANLETHLWQAVGSNIYNVGKELLASENRSSLVLHWVTCHLNVS